MQFRGSAVAASRGARVRALVLASVAALVVTSFDAHAAPVASSPAPPSAKQGAAQELAADNSEFGARKRYRARRGNSAAGLAMMGMMIGTIGAVVAAEQRRDAYRRSYYAPYGYGHPHVYHNPHALQAGPLYGGHHYGRHHHHWHTKPRIGW